MLPGGSGNGIIVYTCVHKGADVMETIGIREFRENLAEILLDSSTPIAITRHGETIGFYIPARRKRTDEEKAALQLAKKRLDEILAAQGVSEDEVIEDFKRWRKANRQK